MSETVSQKDLQKMRRGGAKVRKKPAPTTSTVDKNAALLAQGQAIVAKSMDNLADVMKAVQAKLAESDKEPRPYTFTVHRDKKGLLTSVTAKPGK